jgi:L-alanine-DL-glutamate epimerase-like enolase superfamily enzyme
VIIKTIEPIAVSLPMLKPVVMAGEVVGAADNVLVRIEAGDGLVGWGEAAAAPTMTGETVASMVAAVHYLVPTLAGRAAGDIDGLMRAMDGRMFGNQAAKAAIEIAVHDLVGKATSRPVHALLGERRRHRMAVLGVIGGGDLDGDLRDAAAKKAAGFTIFKIKVGIDTPAQDAERTRQICQLLGAGGLISADANQGFDTAQAIAFVRALAGAGLDFFEQPVAAHDLAGMAAVAAASDIVIGADEGIHSLDDIRRHHKRKAARGVSLKAIKLGGMRAVAAAGALCDQLGMSVNVACKTGESSIACAAALHIACVIPAIAWGVTMTNGALCDDLTPHPIRVDNGHVDALDRPGLGILVDEDRVRRHRIDLAARRRAI